MRKTLSCLTLFLILFTTILPHQAFAQQSVQQQTSPTYFSFFENYLRAYNIIDEYNKRILTARTKTQVTPTPTSVPPTTEPTQFITQSPSQPTTQPSPTGQQIANPLSDVSSYILKGVNEYRVSLGLSQVQSSKQTCDFATIRAKEIASSFNHDGFYNRVNNHTLPYSSWTRAVENIAETPHYQDVVTLWKNSPGHAANMRDNTPYVCIAQYGNYYAYEGMHP